MSKNESAFSIDEAEVLVRVNKVGKIFCRDLKTSLIYGLRDGLGDILPPLRRKFDADGTAILRKSEFWSNDKISFELRRGECLGLIGHNGAGKTTLLKMLNGLIKPDAGSIEMRGRVGALIALGAGFNPILTGRENVYIAGSVLGLSKGEIDSKYDEIIDFAGIKDFMNTPVQSYSSGMQVRLGFAIASTLDPDILIIDEVLAVGDQNFKDKCYQRIGSALKTAAVIFVTHNMAQISRICTKALVLSRGRAIYQGDVASAVRAYEESNEANDVPNPADRFEKYNESIEMVELEVPNSVERGDIVEIRYTIRAKELFDKSFFFLNFTDTSNSIVSQCYCRFLERDIALKKGDNQFVFNLGPIQLSPGKYFVSFIHKDKDGLTNLYWNHKSISIEVSGQLSYEAKYIMPEPELRSINI